MSEGFTRPIATRDPQSVLVGGVTAFLVHALILVLAVGPSLCGLRQAFAFLGARQCPQEAGHRRSVAPLRDEEIIEGALLRQGGGGEVDPRRMIHRQTPIRAEERAHAMQGLAKNANHVPVDAGIQRDPNALVTERDILGRGNQDLAERLRRQAEAEAETLPGTMPGPGSPDGSVNGTETDPNRAGHGAQAKIRSFLQRNLHLLATAPTSAHRTFRLRIVLTSDGASLERGQIVQGSGDDTTDADLAVQLAQLAENHTPIPELTDEEKAAIGGHSYIVRYVPE